MPDTPWSDPAHDPVADMRDRLIASHAVGQTPIARVTVSPTLYGMIERHRPDMLPHVEPISYG